MLYDGRECEDSPVVEIFVVLICEIKVSGGTTPATHL